MPILAGVFLFIVFIGTSMSLHNASTMAEIEAKADLQAASGSMIVYKRYEAAYAAANPATTGSVADTVLGLPTWYSKMSGLQNYVSGGKGYVYYATAESGLAAQLFEDTEGSLFVGTKDSGFLVTPSSGATSIPVPSAIPDGAIVYAG